MNFTTALAASTAAVALPAAGLLVADRLAHPEGRQSYPLRTGAGFVAGGGLAAAASAGMFAWMLEGTSQAIPRSLTGIVAGAALGSAVTVGAILLTRREPSRSLDSQAIVLQHDLLHGSDVHRRSGMSDGNRLARLVNMELGRPGTDVDVPAARQYVERFDADADGRMQRREYQELAHHIGMYQRDFHWEDASAYLGSLQRDGG